MGLGCGGVSSGMPNATGSQFWDDAQTQGPKPLLKAMRTECCQNFMYATVDRLSQCKGRL